MKVQILRPDAVIPTRANPGDAGLDLYSCEDVTLFGFHTFNQIHLVKIHTGIAIELPPNTVGLIWDKSSFGVWGIKVLGGVIDEGYRGEIIVTLANFSTMNKEIKKGMKIVQLIIQPVIYCEPEFSVTLSSTERGAKGFGSSGS